MVVGEGAKGLAALKELKAERPFVRLMGVAEDVNSLVVQRVLKDALISALPMAGDVGVVKKVVPELLGVSLVCV